MDKEKEVKLVRYRGVQYGISHSSSIKGMAAR